MLADVLVDVLEMRSCYYYSLILNKILSYHSPRQTLSPGQHRNAFKRLSFAGFAQGRWALLLRLLNNVQKGEDGDQVWECVCVERAMTCKMVEKCVCVPCFVESPQKMQKLGGNAQPGRSVSQCALRC